MYYVKYCTYYKTAKHRFDYRGNWSFSHLYDDPAADYGGVGHLDDIRFFMT